MNKLYNIKQNILSKKLRELCLRAMTKDQKHFKNFEFQDDLSSRRFSQNCNIVWFQ